MRTGLSENSFRFLENAGDFGRQRGQQGRIEGKKEDMAHKIGTRRNEKGKDAKGCRRK